MTRQNQSGLGCDAALVIRVGSLNPVKLGAIREVMCVPFPLARFEPVPAPSEVPDQPLGLEETLRGAKNRARNALDRKSVV